MNQHIEKQIVNSALWAAYGDALGFPTELVNEDGVKRRLGQSRISQTSSWERMVGGKFGTLVKLVPGSYSDDTQLRLSTSRSIRGDGHFDIETFSKIELPVWLSYSLGAGRGSKLGASSLGQRNIAWFSNFFDQKDTRYINGGGNGAAMRIQPHVWASTNLTDPASYIPDVVRNSLCTHGHPRGIAGAVIHAACLAAILLDGEMPKPDQWKDLGLYIDMAAKFVSEDSELRVFWLPTWNDRSREDFLAVMRSAKVEWEADVESCLGLLSNTARVSYEKSLEALGAKIPEQRGSGLKSALFSLIASWLYRGQEPASAIETVANCLGSDTDTIGTMTGALLGALLPEFELEDEIQDRDYIVAEAKRLFRISRGEVTFSFAYPDLLKWQAPKSQSDGVGIINNQLAVAGLGFAKPVGEEFKAIKGDHIWQWLKLDFGQTILCKQRVPVPPLPKNAYPASVDALPTYVRPAQLDNQQYKQSVNDLFSEIPKNRTGNTGSQVKERAEGGPVITRFSEKISSDSRAEKGHSFYPTLNELTDKAIRSGLDPKIIGIDLLSFAERPDGVELAIAYSAIIVKARLSRLRSNKN